MGGKSSTARKGPMSQQSKIGQRLVKAMSERAASGDGTRLKTFNSIIMKFPKIDEALEQVRVVFRKYDKDGNGTIDLEELSGCFKELRVAFTDEEVRAYHAECDMDSNHGIDFKEFIVLLALVYLVGSPPDSSTSTARIGLPQLEATFETIADCFVFFDRDGDGYVTKTEMIYAINEASPGTTRTADKIGVKRFEEMDWDRDGSISFKEFLFAFTSWVGLEQEGS
eukprot:TRINITY_DN4865_c0_g1_i1.p1 TRINITY_DN4865_c0_g1~~TRINITY_DN4865_c0_g1_i1.p1  ORF type:complete len:225 (-),score=43.44 TRINITY_DN4865_c0_g1_i1:212-886(-)